MRCTCPLYNRACMTSAQLRSLRRTLLRWYDQNRRDLPWRRDRDPYRIWVSEIMLQQTRVAAVLDHYARFLQRFPSVEALASARETSVLAAWSGLGYYHRARRMHQAAKVIAREMRGRFPQTAEEWSLLPGIGRYTAAAIASIAFREAAAVVDGNVERVLQRLLPRQLKPARDKNKEPGTAQLKLRPFQAAFSKTTFNFETSLIKVQTREVIWRQAEALLDRERPGDFNQAMMELGATICTPREPNCSVCPLKTFCSFCGSDPLRPQAPRKRKQASYALVRKNSSVLLVRRAADASLMAGMWELPSLDPARLNGDAPLLCLRHSITDTDYRVTIFAFAPEKFQSIAPHARWVTLEQLEQRPLTGLARKVLRAVLRLP